MADASNQEAGKAPVKETSDFAQSTQSGEAATDPKPEAAGKPAAAGRIPQAGR